MSSSGPWNFTAGYRAANYDSRLVSLHSKWDRMQEQHLRARLAMDVKVLQVVRVNVDPSNIASVDVYSTMEC